MKINVSSRLMDNFITGSDALIAANTPFKVKQGLKGHSIVFSTGTDGSFYLTREEENSPTGWAQINLGKEIAEQVFKNAAIEIVAFDVRQEQLGQLTLAVIIRKNKQDYFYKGMYAETLKNNQGVEEIKHQIIWSEMLFDYAGNYPKMEGVILSLTSPHALVSFDDNGALGRYKVSLEDRISTKRWIMCNFGVAYTKKGIKTLFGQANESAGAYTLGQNQLVYQSLEEGRRGSAISASVSRLDLGENHHAAAMAVAKQMYDDEDTTALFVVSKEGSLFYFSPDQQADFNSGKLCFADDWLLKDCQAIEAEIVDDQVTVWVLNGMGELSYASCPLNSVTDPNAWQKSLPILVGVEQLQPFVNHVDGTNTIFAYTGGNQLVRLEKSPDGEAWTKRNINLPSGADQDVEVKHIHSQTVQVTVTNEEDQPLAHTAIYISSSNRASYLINNVYKVLTPQHPTAVYTDAAGAISIIEPVEGVSANELSFRESPRAKVKGTANANQEAFDKLMALNTASKLKAAQVTNDDGTSSRLIPDDTTEETLQQVAASITALESVGKAEKPNAKFKPAKLTAKQAPETIIAYDPEQGSRGIAPSAAMSLDRGVGSVFQKVKASFSDAMLYIDTLVQRSKRFVLKVGKYVKAGIEKGVKIALEVGGKIVEFVAKTVRAVVDVLAKVWDAIKVTAKKVWNYIKFLFAWDDIKRTKEVLKDAIKDFLENQVVGSLKQVKTDVYQFFEAIKKNLQDFRTKHFKDLPHQSSMAMPQGEGNQHMNTVNSSESKFLSNHLQNNYKGDGPPQPDVDDLKGAPKGLLECLGELAKEFGHQVVNGSLNPKKLADKFFELLEIVVGLAQSAVDKVMEVLISFVEKIFSWLDEPIEIPVVTHLLKKYLGLPSFSLLDIICYVAAIPTTIIYKIIADKAPVEPGESWASISKSDVPQQATAPMAATVELTSAAASTNLAMEREADYSSVLRAGKPPGYVVKYSLKWYAILRIAGGVLRVGQFGDLNYMKNNVGGLSYGPQPFKTLGTVLKICSEAFDITANLFFAKVEYPDSILGSKVWKFISGFFGVVKFLCYGVKFITIRENQYMKFGIDKTLTYIRVIPAVFEVFEFFIAQPRIVLASGATNIALTFRNAGRFGNAGYNVTKAILHTIQSPEPTVITVMGICIGVDMLGRIGEGITILVATNKINTINN